MQTLFHDLWEIPDTEAATTFLSQWYTEAAADAPALTPFAQTVEAHWPGIVE